MTIDILKTVKGDIDAKQLMYLEMGGETDTHIYLIDGIEPVEKGDEYVFFLNEHGVFLSPMTLIPVIDNNVKLEGKIFPDDQLKKYGYSDEMLVDDYLEAVYNILNMQN